MSHTEVDYPNLDWVAIYRDLLDDANVTIHSEVTSRAEAGGSFEAALRPDARGAVSLAGLRGDPTSEPLAALFQVAMMAAHRLGVHAVSQLDGALLSFERLPLMDSHLAVAPVARTAIEHLAAAVWLLDPSITPQTAIARYLKMVKANANAAAGLRASSLEARTWILDLVARQSRVFELAGKSLKKGHRAPVNATMIDQIERALALGAELGIEQPGSDTMAVEMYGLLSAWAHPNFIEQILGDSQRLLGKHVRYEPTGKPQLSRLGLLVSARLLRVLVELELRLAGSENAWAERSLSRIRQL